MKFIVLVLALGIFLSGCLGPPQPPSDFVECNFDEKCGDNLLNNCWKGHVASKMEEPLGDLSISMTIDLTVTGPKENKCTFEFSFSHYEVLDPAHTLDEDTLNTLNSTLQQEIYGKKATCEAGLAEMMQINVQPEKLLDYCTGPLADLLSEGA